MQGRTPSHTLHLQPKPLQMEDTTLEKGDGREKRSCWCVSVPLSVNYRCCPALPDLMVNRFLC